MKYAIIGCGRIAVHHMKASMENHLSVAAVCDLQQDKMEGLLSRYPECGAIKRYTDYREMVREIQPDLVSIATESGAHAEIALYCISRGVHVIIEKPMALSISEADKIVSLAEEKNVRAAVCHQNRFNPAVQKLRRALEAGRFGKLSHGAVHVRWNRGRDYYSQADWRGTWAHDGGVLMNQCIHGIDLLRWMMGSDIVKVYGQVRKRFHNYLETEDMGLAVVEFQNGAMATVEGTSNVYPQNLEETLYLFGEKGTVKLGGKSTNNIELWNFSEEQEEDENNKSFIERTENVYGNGHPVLFADMVDAIRTGRPPYVDAAEGRKALELVLAIYKSQKEGQEVLLPLKDFSTMEMRGIPI